MSNKKVGSIIQMGSNSSLLGLAGYPAYVTAKAGIIGLAKALARELGVNGIRVNTLIPGWVMTERQKKLWVTEEALKEMPRPTMSKTSHQRSRYSQRSPIFSRRRLQNDERTNPNH